MFMAPMFQGFGLTISLITAIGAQNAFVLKQGLKRHHLLLTATLCILFDCILVSVGVLGVSFIIEENPRFVTWFRIFGASFLFYYGIKSIHSALRAKIYTMDSRQVLPSRRATILALLGFTFLNPHTYLDTIMLIGSAGAQYEFFEQILYIVGALSASTLWFFSLTYGAGKLAHYFQKTKTWQIFDICVGIFMFVIALTLLFPLSI